MTGNIVINAIPSKYVDSTAAAAFFENGSYGKLADLGAYYYSGSDGSKTAISTGTLASGVQIVESYGSSYKVVVFRRSLPVAKFKRYVAVVQATGSVYKNLYMCIGTSNIKLISLYAYAS